MFNNIDLTYELKRLRKTVLSSEDKLLIEAKHLLKKERLSTKQILENLTLYNQTFEDLDERNLDEEYIFHPAEIKALAVTYRLKFLDTKYYKKDIPEEAILKIEYLNQVNRREIKTFKLLAPAENFGNTKADFDLSSMLFAKTNEDNYYLVHAWGKELHWFRKYLYLPLRSFENLVLTVLITTLIIDLIIPTRLITLDHKAEYWSGYRAAAFFHLLIFNFGVTVYFTFTFAKNFSSAIWNQYKDFD